MILYWLVKIILWPFFKICFSFSVQGVENIPRRGGFILASNHASFLDPVVLGIASPRRLNFMAREDLFRNRLFGKLISITGALPLDKETSGIRTVKGSLRRLKAGGALVIFPEGTRSFNGSLGKGSSGVGLLMLKADVPAVPVYLKGTEKALGRGAKFIRCKKVSVYFGERIEPVNYTRESKQGYRDMAERVMREIRRLKEVAEREKG